MSTDKIKPYKDLDEWVPLSKVVDYAVIDDYDDAQVNRQRFNNWAIRGYRKLNLNLLRIVKDVLIPVDPRTGTGRLPDDFRKVISAGYYNMCGDYTPITQVALIEVLDGEKSKCGCEKCGCSKDSFCDSVSFERLEEPSEYGASYINTIIRKFDKASKTYKEQREEWITKDGSLIQSTTVRDLCTLDVQPCGCISETTQNIERLRSCGCCGVWDYFGTRGNYCYDDYFSIDEKNRLIHVGDGQIRFVRMKYWAYLPCIDGEVYFPGVAVECLAAWILWKRDSRRRGIGLGEKQLSYLQYKQERRELRRNLFPIRISVVRNALNLIPY
jgi:hypothetical protein